MSEMGDEQDQAEALDWDTISTDEEMTIGGVVERTEPPDFPPNRPMGSLDDTATQRVEQVRESLADRVAREEPDPLIDALEGRERLVPEPAVGGVAAEEAAVHAEDAGVYGFPDQLTDVADPESLVVDEELLAAADPDLSVEFDEGRASP